MSPEKQRIAIAEAAQNVIARHKAEKRFFAKVKVCPNGSACWEWQGHVASNGYGRFWDGDRVIQAHWFLMPTRPSKGQEACHSCDNKLCVNPDHLSVGTRIDNMKDMVSKKRHNTRPGCLAMLKVRRIKAGEDNHQAVLSDADAALIKSIKPARGRGVAVAKHFGVSASVVSGIWKGKRWARLVPDATAAQRAAAFLRTLGQWEP